MDSNIFEDFSTLLSKYIKRHVSCKEDAEDILQDVLLKIYNNIENLNDNEKIYAYIYKIARNSIYDYYRKQNKSNENYTPELEYFLDDETANREISRCVKSMVDYLPEKYRQAIILTEFQGLTQKEVSEILKISLSGVKSRVQRARKLLKKMLYECCNLEFDSLGNVIDFEHKTKDCKFC
ncbi:RNA polymerase, sigma subunit, SigZ [Caloramator quimbayensis]|uniref:RNA polymerase sigma factor n=1 Tax=Caloramator quimbayensis TaxID=1147123 RepID=A0A1T4XWT0_9CLOT|nr:RNA polymerase sigma factor SigZ [Caloramator quimbayensis]SKA93980.1 RNA polymerase, sigma subunit, SigZ [Caloramator quimbayensis]